MGEKNSVPENMLSSGKCVMAPERRGEVRATLADISLAKKLLNWSPEMKFEDGIRKLKEMHRIV